MTFISSQQVTWAGEPQYISDLVERVLIAHPHYRKVVREDRQIYVRYRPPGWPMVLESAFQIDVEQAEQGSSRAKVTLISQKFVAGDMFDRAPVLIGAVFEVILRYWDAEYRSAHPNSH